MKKYCPTLALLLLFAFPTFAQTQLIWTTFGQGRLSSCNLDGTGLQERLTFEGSSTGLTVDPENMLLYWVNNPKGQILRADYTFQSIDTLLEGLDNPQQVVLDPDNGKIYWSDTGSDHIQRANTDGSGREIVYEEIALNPIALYLSASSQNLYFSRQSGIIGKINLNTFSVDTIAQVSGIPTELEVDPDQMKLYWSNQGIAESKIQRCNLNGTNVEDLVSGLGKTYGIALDRDVQKIYWTDWGGTFPKYIKRANLDGSGVENVIELANSAPYALSLIDNLAVDVDDPLFTTDHSFQVFPNPTSGWLQISGDLEAIEAVRVMDHRGNQVKAFLTNQENIDLTDLPAGAYIILLYGPGRVVSRKIIKI